MATLARALRASVPVVPLPQSRPTIQRRRFARASYLAPVRLLRPGQQTSEAQAQDISEGGMLLVGPHGLEAAQELHIRFALPRSGKLATVRAMTRWVRAARDGRDAIGLEFVEPPDHVRSDIVEYVGHFTGPDSEPGSS
jgi:c-di-GMP-binding flagellar brake protein YcgR